MDNNAAVAPDSTAVRVALWRALHLEVDAPPHIIEDDIGLRLAAPDPAWRDRPDMNPEWTSRFRASILARARFIEDLVIEQAAHDVRQYVILGAGLDSFAQRRPEIAAGLTVFEVDRFGTQLWKQQRLIELGFGIPEWLRLVPVDFENQEAWLARLATAGFEKDKPAVFASTGVTMYLTKEATAATLREIAALARGTTMVMSFILPVELAEPDERPGLEAAVKGARASGTPFISFYTAPEMLALARDCGFREVQHVSATNLTQRYFSGRSDNLRPGSEELLIATV